MKDLLPSIALDIAKLDLGIAILEADSFRTPLVYA